MSPYTEIFSQGGLLDRTAMSTRELERVEVMGRVAIGALRLVVDTAAMLQVSYRQAKRLCDDIGEWAERD